MSTREWHGGNVCTAFASVDEVFLSEFSAHERAYSNMLPTSKRAEHLAGVVALRRAVSELYPDVAHIEILRQHDAAPIVLLDGEPLAAGTISVSHSQGVGFAVATREYCMIGVDIQSSERFPLTPEQFFSQEELEWKTLNTPVLLWAYKEALLKALGVGLVLHPKRLTLSLNDAGELCGAKVDHTALCATGIQVRQIPGSVSVFVTLKSEGLPALSMPRERSYYSAL